MYHSVERMEPFVFVVLHYLNYEDTVECVDSLLKIDDARTRVVVVDNGSSNESGRKLEARYRAEDRVDCLLSEENLGFARGNNLGYRYARNELGAGFVCLLNNDTVIEQRDFVRRIREKYAEDPFDILGPDIVTLKGEHQNPAPVTLQDREVLRKKLRLWRVQLFLSYFAADVFLENVKKAIFPKPLIPRAPTVQWDYSREYEGVKLHGCALCFSPRYVERYEEALHPGTFMFAEEEILYQKVKREGLRTVYFPKVRVVHKEDRATDEVYNTSLKKRRFIYRNSIRSGKILLKLLEDE